MMISDTNKPRCLITGGAGFICSHLAAERLGHLTGDVYLYLAERHKRGTPRRTWHILLSGEPCNRNLLSMWQRKLSFYERRWASRLWHYCKPVLRRTRFDVPHEQTDDIHEEMSTPGLGPEFTEEEERRGQELLRHMGIGPDEWFAVAHVRDIVYTRSRFPHLSETELVQVTSKNAVRMGNIADYMAAAEHITSLGGFFVRMGAVVEHPMPIQGNPRVIDYSRDHRSEFGDIYLASKARFYLGGPSGLPQASSIFGVPVAMANTFQLPPHPVGEQGLYIPVFLRELEDGRIIHFREAYERGLYEFPNGSPVHDARILKTYGLEVVYNSDDDILDLCKDILDKVNGRSVPAEAATLQAEYHHAFTAGMRGYLHAPPIGARFALKYRHLIE